MRFEPGVEKTVELVELGGTRTVPGLRLPEGTQRNAEQWAYLIDELQRRLRWDDWQAQTAPLS